MSEIKRFERKLNEEAIVEITESLGTWLAEKKVKSKNRTIFMLESILLDLNTHFEDEHDITVLLVKRFGRFTIKVLYSGESFNPSNDDVSPQTRFYLENLGLVPSWSYKKDLNEISLEVPKNPMKDESLLILAAIAAIISGILLPLLPGDIVSFISQYILQTLADVFMNLLFVFAGLLIFFSILSGICGMGSVSDLNTKGKYMMSRTMLESAAASFVCTFVLIPFYKFTYGESGSGGGPQEIYSLITAIIPSNPITPFIEGNMLQVCIIAMITGTVMIILGNRVDQVTIFASQCSSLFLSIVEAVCKLLPIYIYASLTILFVQNGIGMILTLWKPIAVCIGINAALALIRMLMVSFKYKISLPVLFKKIYPTFIIALTTASSMSAFSTSLEVNETKLGIDKSYNNFATPLKNLMYGLTIQVSLIVIIYYLTEYSGIPISPFWFINVWIIAVLIEPAIPPISGGPLVCVGIIMDLFGIPRSALVLAATLSLLFDFIMTASKSVLIHMDVIEEADHFGLLDLDALRKADNK
ncbi:dicarboxylate/amino acid:cation symporter [Butyrivibrio sp. AE2032]|uniref:dicarboxylate/amino acid:cation symporter n=1 Tax=Butyrivibrio sp. AE2032 TaxID=1458463 RepID=UPI0005512EB7|nr:cation:dicarboxylase symporter family transporter [Butyrivibrio sp. AE2032]